MTHSYKSILERQLADVSGSRRIYLDQILRDIADHPGFFLTETLASMILVRASATLPMSLSPGQVCSILDAYLTDKADWIRKHIFTRSFVFDSLPIIEALSEGFLAEIAATTLDAIKEGAIVPEEKIPYRFSWPNYSNQKFPYWEEEEV